ncbi:MAG: hypothetical protein PHQ62_03405 [Clostridia bacterium]|nr:hypothetical protein [Clostridia bacterium]
MAGKAVEKISESEKIIKLLTGQVGVDKKLLISFIAKLRNSKTDFNEDIKILGQKLYKILLDNGLNESEIINKTRLLDKVEAYIYEKQYEQALELLEVLDSQELFVPYDKNGQKVYYVSNIIEAGIISNIVFNEKVKDINWSQTTRNIYLNFKIQIFLEQGKTKDAQQTINNVLFFNPANFGANYFQAKFFKQTNLAKQKAQILKCYAVAFTTAHLIGFFELLSNFYEADKKYINAYFILNAIALFDNIELVSSDLERLEIEINKTAIERFKKPTSDQIFRFLKRENIPFAIKESTFNFICNTFTFVLIKDYENDLLIDFLKKYILEITNNDTNFVKNLEKFAKEEREKGEK